MKLKLLLLAAVLLQLPIADAWAQVETKPVQVRTFEGDVEEYSVLANNRKVRQGAYVRYRPATFAGLVVFEAGSYEQGLKEGEWRVFSQDRPWNCLVSKGGYHAGMPEGMWSYYHFKFMRGGPFARGATPAAQATAKGPEANAGL